VKVGAGCEVKNSIVMRNTRIPHLSYVGDSVIGEDCSLGAGTITANLRFDEAEVRSKIRGSWVNSGRKKLGAILGDRVRTGINVSIFPGVKVGGGSWIGPGAIVDRDVPSNARYKAS
jgi:bifunctional UDP-N-acetylglucosamine pyrophosphorylase/glucosamine-1-phosphate N-acetyltransferase